MAVGISGVLQRLRGVKKSGGGYMAKCPAHDDETASLSVAEGEAGRVLFHCHAGCNVEDVAGALGLSMRDLMGEEKREHSQSTHIVATYHYQDESGAILYRVIRKEPKDFYVCRPDGHGGWTYNLNGVRRVPYNLQAFLSSDNVFLVEGEKDVDTLSKIGLAATCSTFGAGSGKFAPELASHFANKDVYIIPDNDAPGKAFALDEARVLAPVAKSVKVLDPLALCPELPEHGDITDIVERYGAEHTKAALREVAESTPEYAPPGDQGGRERAEDPLRAAAPEWPELLPFEQCGALPSFPLDALPLKTRAYIRAVSETVQAPVDMVGPCVLGALQIACLGRYPVCLPDDHIERPCLYIAPIARPSERKSGVIDVVTRPLIDHETEYNRIRNVEVNQSRSERKLLEGRISRAEHNAINEKDAGKRRSAEMELQALNAELAEFEAVEPLRLFGADVTPEKLAAMLKSQGAVFALVSAEGGSLFENIGRYSDRGGLDIYLQGYSGDRVCVDRKNSESIVIDRPTLTIIAPCQPYVIEDLFSDKQKAGRGLLSRILYIKCKSCVGSRKAMSKPLDERIAAHYRNLCHSMLDCKSSGNLFYDPSGFSVQMSFHDEIEPQLTPDVGELALMGELMSEWAGKLPGQMTRQAGLIHCIAAFEQGKDPLDTEISADEARAAVELARYFLAHAKAVFTEQAEPEAIRNARYLLGKIKAANSPQISKSALTRMTQGKRGLNHNESLTVLIERGYIRVERTQSGNAGRPSETIIVNPRAQGDA